MASTCGDSTVHIVSMAFKYLWGIDGSVPKCGRASKTALERDISARLDKMPHVSVKGKGRGKAGTSSNA